MSTDPAREELESTLEMMLANDGYSAVIKTWPPGGEGHARVEIVAGPEACADCLVPRDVLAMVLADRLPPGLVVGAEDLVYPDAR